MNVNLKQIKVIPAEIENKIHMKEVWNIYNENIGVNLVSSEPIPYHIHCKWWKNAFDKEYIYLILYKSIICGYIRLTKYATSTKEKFEISIALAKKYQEMGMGSVALKLFENNMTNLGISYIKALNMKTNIAGKFFFLNNQYKEVKMDKEREYRRYIKKLI